MKFVKSLLGHNVPVSNEENLLLTKVIESKTLSVDDMKSREHQLAENLVKRGVLSSANGAYSMDRHELWRK